MGMYINPPNMTKEEFLKKHGERVSLAVLKSEYATKSSDDYNDLDKLPVVLVDNGLFTAAAIAFSNTELRYFIEVTDPRPKTYWVVSRALLLPYMSD